MNTIQTKKLLGYVWLLVPQHRFLVHSWGLPGATCVELGLPSARAIVDLLRPVQEGAQDLLQSICLFGVIEGEPVPLLCGAHSCQNGYGNNAMHAVLRGRGGGEGGKGCVKRKGCEGDGVWWKWKALRM